MPRSCTQQRARASWVCSRPKTIVVCLAVSKDKGIPLGRAGVTFHDGNAGTMNVQSSIAHPSKVHVSSLCQSFHHIAIDVSCFSVHAGMTPRSTFALLVGRCECGLSTSSGTTESRNVVLKLLVSTEFSVVLSLLGSLISPTRLERSQVCTRWSSTFACSQVHVTMQRLPHVLRARAGTFLGHGSAIVLAGLAS
eukprot:jgi/Bigna1/74019/fgenesh1_pg.27_\